MSLQHILSHMCAGVVQIALGKSGSHEPSYVLACNANEIVARLLLLQNCFLFLWSTCISVKMVRGFFGQCIFRRGGSSLFSAFHSDVLCEMQGMVLRPAVLKLAA